MLEIQENFQKQSCSTIIINKVNRWLLVFNAVNIFAMTFTDT